MSRTKNFLFFTFACLLFASIMAINIPQYKVLTQSEFTIEAPGQIDIQKEYPREVYATLQDSLRKWGKGEPKNNVFTVTNTNNIKNLYTFSIGEGKPYGDKNPDELIPANVKELENFELIPFEDAELFAVYIIKKADGSYLGASSTNLEDLSKVLKEVPDEIIEQKSKDTLLIEYQKKTAFSMFSIKAEAAQSYDDYRMSYESGIGYQITNGWHGSGYRSIDMIPPGANGVIKASASGVITNLCINSSTKQSYIEVTTLGTGEKMGYRHIDNTNFSTGIYEGAFVWQNKDLGTMVPGFAGTMGSSCGYSQGTHVHMELPSQNFVWDGYNFSSSNANLGATLFSSNKYCAPPGLTPGNQRIWRILSSCDYEQNQSYLVPGDISIELNSILGIRPWGSLNSDLDNHSIRTRPGSKIFIYPGGKIN
jgi:hypothetical protein